MLTWRELPHLHQLASMLPGHSSSSLKRPIPEKNGESRNQPFVGEKSALRCPRGPAVTLFSRSKPVCRSEAARPTVQPLAHSLNSGGRLMVFDHGFGSKLVCLKARGTPADACSRFIFLEATRKWVPVQQKDTHVGYGTKHRGLRFPLVLLSHQLLEGYMNH